MQTWLKCTICKRWIHKRYCGVRGNLSLVVDGVRCNRCDGRSPISHWSYIDVHDNSNTHPL